MHFTEGQLHQYERMMQEKPGYDRGPIKTLKEPDCKRCLHSDERCNKRGKEKCTLFED